MRRVRMAALVFGCGAWAGCQAPSAGVVSEQAAAINGLVDGAGHVDSLAVAGEIVKGPTAVTSDGVWQCRETPVSDTATPELWVMLDPKEAIYPCAVDQGATIGSGDPAPVPVKRAKACVTLRVVSGNPQPVFRCVDNPTPSTMTQAQNDILAGYQNGFPTSFSYSYKRVYSEKQMALLLGVNANWLGGHANAGLHVDESEKRNRVLISLVENAYTMSCDPPAGASGAFAPEVTPADLQPYVGPGNPPVYVGSVSFGRIFYMMLESTAGADDLDASVDTAVNFVFGKVGGQVSSQQRKILTESRMTILAYGGNARVIADAAKQAAGGDPVAFMSALLAGSGASHDNVMAPISYSMSYLANAARVRLSTTAEYVKRDCTPVATSDGGKCSTEGAVESCGNQIGACAGAARRCVRGVWGLCSIVPDSSWHKSPAPNGSWDWDCNGVEEPQYRVNGAWPGCRITGNPRDLACCGDSCIPRPGSEAVVCGPSPNACGPESYCGSAILFNPGFCKSCGAPWPPNWDTQGCR